MDPIRAKFAGTCARTGQPYKQGDLIVKTAKGWALAQDKKGNIKIAPEFRLARMPDGSEKQIPVHLPLACSQCLRAAGHDTTRLPKDFDFAPFHMARQGDTITCPRCGRRIEIIPSSELDRRQAEADAAREAAYAAEREAKLHLTPVMYGFYQLSHRLPADQWARVAHHFTYWSHDDLDQMDYFDMPGGYYLLGDPVPAGILLNGAPSSSMSRAELVEEALNIRPENRLSVLVPKWEQQAQARKEAAILARERESAYRRLFDWKQPDATREDGEPPAGERIPIGNQDGAKKYLVVNAEETFVWDYFRGWADMVVEHCYRFPLTTERQEVVQWIKEGWIK